MPTTPRVVVVLLAAASVGLAVGGSAALAGQRPVGPRVLDVNVSANNTFTSGEPEIAVDPTHPDVVIEGYTVGHFNTANDKGMAWAIAVEHGQHCGYSISYDRGRTWSAQRRAPLTAPEVQGGFSSCGDTSAAAGPDGTLYLLGAVYNDSTDALPFTPSAVGADAVISSRDQGRTWSAPSYVMKSTDYPDMIARGQQPGSIGFASPWDRPFIEVDQSDGTVYVSATGHTARHVAASHDHGVSWTPVEAYDSAPYVGEGGGLHGAAHGVLATAYSATTGPAGPCSCLIFQTSKDAGRTWNRHEVGVSGFTGTDAAANPARHGAFALLQASGSSLQVIRTTDSGKSWKGPVTVGNHVPDVDAATMPWIAYSPQGVLGVMWRAVHPGKIANTPLSNNGPYDVYAAFSRDNGATFTAPVKVTSKPSPPVDLRIQVLNPIHLDEFSFITMDREYAHIAWGDWRSGEQQAWYGRVRFSAFLR